MQLFAALALVLFVPGPVARIASAAPPAGASSFIAVTPSRLVDTRAGEGAFGFARISSNVIRVKVAGLGGVPTTAVAAVLNVTIVDPVAAGFATVFPSGEPLPVASSLNADWPGRVIANMVTAKLGADGSVDIYTSVPMNLAVDISGAYVPANVDVAAGRLVTVPGGSIRVMDTRATGFVDPGITRAVDLRAAGVPNGASAVVVNLTAADAVPGFWTAYPASTPRPATSTLNIDELWQTRPGQAIVPLTGGAPFINVYTQSGGQLIVDVAGWFTGASSPVGSDGLFVPATPRRLLDTRDRTALAPWNGSAFEFDIGSPGSPVSAVALNITATDPWEAGFVTAYPAGAVRPSTSSLNLVKVGQTIANHAITRVTNRGAAVFTQSGVHLVVDLAGWYLGVPGTASQPVPLIPTYTPNVATQVAIPSIQSTLPIGTGKYLDPIADRGIAAGFTGLSNVAATGNVMLFAHRTTHGGVWRWLHAIPIGATFTLTGADGHLYDYVVYRRDVVRPTAALIANLTIGGGPITAQLVACSKPNFEPTSTSFRIVITGRLYRVR